ncbi:phage tail protein [Chromobacterium violaceum]|uniref:phage tail protein n=1 Tax=Chromobacterium violaceum TaxID=536 RepID=UPI001B32610B|nr:phage tail protein [Chromobacterium violaceum]MBP4049310.1 phage tail protein [Chromobacterium violaceum]
MSNDFFTILTVVGKAKLAAAASGGAPLKLSQMAVGEGDNGAYYTPSESQTALKSEAWRAGLNHLSTDPANPNWIVAELVIPDQVGGFTIREVGVFDADGALFAVGKFPESYKPVLADGANKQLYVRMILEVSNAAAVTLMVDPSVVLATRGSVDQRIAEELAKLDGKPSVRAATTAPIALAGLQTVDGVVLQLGDRVLVKNQAAGADNGIYVAGTGSWARAADANISLEVTPGLFVAVEQGAANGGSLWQLTTPSPIVLGTTALAFTQIAGNTGVAAGTYRSVTVNARGQVVGGSNPSSADDYGLSADLALPLAALPLPVICTPDNRLTVTAAAVAGQGGSISIPAGVTLTLAQEVVAGQTGRVRSFATSAWTSPALQANAEYYLRAQVGAGGLTIYVQRGQLNDAKPDGLKGSANGGSGGGFYSTALDVCLARVLTSAPGSAPTVQRVINRGQDAWSATMNGNGTVYLPFDPFMRTGRISTGIVTPHASAISSVMHGSAGWTGYAYWYAAPSGPNGSSYITGSSLNWAVNSGGILTTSNVVGDMTVSTSTGMFEHITGKFMWQVLQLEHQIGDVTGANGDEHLMGEGTKNLLQADYDSGLAISFVNCVNALLTWEVVR